jgi:hypothetical protein
MLFDGIIKHLLCLRNLLPDLWKVSQLEWRTILINQLFDVKSVESEVVVLNVNLWLRKIKRLMDEIGVSIIHLLQRMQMQIKVLSIFWQTKLII